MRLLTTRSIKHKITLRVGMAVAVVLAVLIGFVSATVRQAQIESTKQRGRILVADMAQQIEAFNREGLVIAKTMAVFQESGAFGNREATLRFLHDLIQSRSEYFGTWTLYARNADGQDAGWIGRPGSHSRTGQFLAFWNPTSTGRKLGAAEDITEAEDSFGIWAMARRPPHSFIMEPYLYNEELQTSYGQAFWIDGTIKGVAGIDRSLRKLRLQLAAEKPYRTAVFVLISPSGRYIVAPDATLQTQPISRFPEQWAVFEGLPGARTQGFQVVTNPFTGHESWMFHAPVVAGNWTLAMLVDQAEVLSPVNRLVGIILGLGLVGLVLVSLLLYGLIARAVSPMDRLVKACEATAQGDLDTVQALVPGVASRDGDEFDRMAAAFRHAVHYLTSMAERLEQVARGDLSVRITPFSDRDRFGKALARYVVMIADTITQLNRAKEQLHESNERLQDLDRLKTDFVNAVSHDLRTPLTSIKGYTEFLEDELGGPLTAQQADYVSQIAKSTSRLEHLVDDLLDVARVEAGTLQLRFEDVDLAAIVREVIDSLLPQAQAARLTLEASLPDEPLRVRCDASRIERVLINLVNNAVKFTPEGGSILVSARLDGEVVRCEVADNGIGIAPEDVPKLFQRFGQLKSGSAKGGTGLGLSISKAIVEAHQGAIGVDSEAGRGSTFWFTLPRGNDLKGDLA